MLCDGTVSARLDPVSATSARRLIAFADVSCQTCAAAPAVKLARDSVTGVLPAILLITITVIAPSEVRVAPKTDRLSGFDDEVVFTLVSPNPESWPS